MKTMNILFHFSAADPFPPAVYVVEGGSSSLQAAHGTGGETAALLDRVVKQGNGCRCLSDFHGA